MIGYCVPSLPYLASHRMRVLIPQKHLKMPYRFGIGDVTFFFKDGNPDLAKRLDCPIVYDVVNPHFSNPAYKQMCELAAVVTCSSVAMQWAIKQAFGKDAVVIPDPYENEEQKPKVGPGLLWFGHLSNIKSVKPFEDLNPTICTGDDWSANNEWSREVEDKALADCGLVLLTGSNPGASANRPIKALRAGRFVVVPEDCPHSWKELSDFIWIGDVREGVHWANENREEACRKVLAGQKFIRSRFSPQLIGSQWAGLFASTLERATSMKKAGSELTSQ